MNTQPLMIRTLHSVEELEEVRRLETIVWSFDDSVPVNQSMAVVKNGGFILGAFYEDQLIAFQYSFPGFDGKKVYLVSQSLGIHPDFRKRGIGEKLKVEQRKTAASMGYDFITWTYDPLETVNGSLNLNKLGAIVRSYLPNVYGLMNDNLNSGIPTDRFLVEWHTKDHKEVRESEQFLPHALITGGGDTHFHHPDKIDLSITAKKMYVAVPGNFQEIKKENLPLAKAWREQTGIVFTHYLEQGWYVTDLVKSEGNTNLYLYLLEKGDLNEN
jgi:predicted GNAT superfamily acetyltransferase